LMAILAPILALGQGQGSGDHEPIILTRRNVLEDGLDVISAGLIEKRQDEGGVVQTNQTNMEAWDADTSAACMEALSQLSVASNPSGTAVCYNLPSLDTRAGSFMADLRLFQISPPTGDFLGIAPRDISVNVQYNGASVSPLSQEIEARSVDESLVKRQSSSPTLLQTYMFVGMLDQSMMANTLTL
jgi:hypothetical protein